MDPTLVLCRWTTCSGAPVTSAAASTSSRAFVLLCGSLVPLWRMWTCTDAPARAASRKTSRISQRDAAAVYWMPIPTASAPRSRPARMPLRIASSCASVAGWVAAFAVAGGRNTGGSPITAIRTGTCPTLAPKFTRALPSRSA